MAAPRILGVGKRAENASAMQQLLCDAGYDARNFAITDDADGDALFVHELTAGCDAVLIGSFINGQHSELPATAGTTSWFNRLLNLVAEHAPGTKVVLVRKPSDVVETVSAVVPRN